LKASAFALSKTIKLIEKIMEENSNEQDKNNVKKLLEILCE
jgi:hypothetical protein